MTEATANPTTEPERYLLPPVSHNADGAMRRVGVEVEFAGVPLPKAAQVVGTALGSTPEVNEETFEASLESRWGTLRLELDATQVRDKKYLDLLESLGIPANSATSQFIDEQVRDLAVHVVPLEVVTPPVPWDELPSLDAVWKALHEAGAQGTRSSALRAFGLHLNPEVESEDPARVIATLQAYLLLEDWLMRSLDIDPSRQVAPFIRPFPEAYRRMVLAPTYHPDWPQLVDDYAEHNPTRNRRVDLWPLIRHVTGDAYASRVSDWRLVKARPTYHYRLPNCEISQAGWTPMEAVNGWVMVERLAHADETRFEMAQAYLETGDLPLRMQKLGWVEQVQSRLHRLAESGDHAAE